MAKRPTGDAKMVLRTVYLPLDLDRDLRGIAFREERSKGDLMRDLLVEALEQRRKAGQQTFAQRAPVAIEQMSAIEVRAEPPVTPRHAVKTKAKSTAASDTTGNPKPKTTPKAGGAGAKRARPRAAAAPQPLRAAV
jgi:hypothetical protein